MTNPVGRPSLYRPEYAEQVYKLCLLGATNEDIAWFFDATNEEFGGWVEDNPELASVMDRRPQILLEGLAIREARRAARRERRRTPKARRAANEYYKNRLKSEPAVRLRHNLSVDIRSRVRGKNGRHVFDILGYSADQLKASLEAQFRPGMSWDNYGQIWHIDHRKPVCRFDLTSGDSAVRECWALSNLQPLFALENLLKGSRYAGA